MKRNRTLLRKAGLTRRRPLTRRPIVKTPDPQLEAYYRHGFSVSTWVCENCDQYIAHSQSWQQFAAQCHILPKDDYPEVRGHFYNRLHLCPSCHNDFDSSWQKASTMDVWPQAIVRLKFFVYLVQAELPLILKYFW